MRNDIEDTYMLGYLAGVINGISYRSDVPPDVIHKCKEVVTKYNVWQDKRLENIKINYCTCLNPKPNMNNTSKCIYCDKIMRKD